MEKERPEQRDALFLHTFARHGFFCCRKKSMILSDESILEILHADTGMALGCTEPIAVAYCAALARKTLGCPPEDVQVYASANIIKNVKSVVVPNTGGQRGLTAAAAAGIANRSSPLQ